MADNLAWTPGSGATIRTDDLGAAGHVQYVKLMDGTDNSSTTIPTGSNGGLFTEVVRVADTAGSGSLTASGQAVTVSCEGKGTIAVQLAGTWVGTVTFEGSIDGGTTYFTCPGLSVAGGGFITTSTVNGQWQFDVAGFSNFRARCSAFTSGSITTNVRASLASLLPPLEDVIGTGSLSALNQAVILSNIDGKATAAVQLAGTFSATVSWEVSNDATTWTACPHSNYASIGSGATGAASVGLYQIFISGAAFFRARVSAYTSGTVVVTARASSAPTFSTVFGVIPGTGSLNIGKNEDGVANSGDVGIAVWAVRASDANSLTSNVSADGDYDALRTDIRGTLLVRNRPVAKRIQVQSAGLTTVTTTYSIGDQAGTIMTFAGAATVSGGTGTIQQITMLDEGNVGTDYRLWIFRSSVTLSADNAAFSISDTDMRACVGMVTMPSLVAGGAPTSPNKFAIASNLNIGYDCAATSLFVAIETRTANAVYAAATDLNICLFCVLD